MQYNYFIVNPLMDTSTREGSLDPGSVDNCSSDEGTCGVKSCQNCQLHSKAYLRRLATGFGPWGVSFEIKF